MVLATSGSHGWMIPTSIRVSHRGVVAKLCQSNKATHWGALTQQLFKTLALHILFRVHCLSLRSQSMGTVTKYKLAIPSNTAHCWEEKHME
eukprot:249299-Amphidinium_carterae.1